MLTLRKSTALIMELGKMQTLLANRVMEQGFYLKDKDGNEVLLPNKYVPEGFDVEQEIEVFVYLDSMQRIVATTTKPLMEVDTFEFLEVKQISKAGYFLDLGIDKELFLPFREALWEYEVNEIILVRMLLDPVTNRLMASARINKYLSAEKHTYTAGDKVEIMIFDEHSLGLNCLIDKSFTGVLYENEIFEDLRIGDKKSGFIKRVRDDGKLDLSLQPFGYRKVELATDTVLKYLNENEGCIELTDKSQPEDIYQALKMSKKVFKKALGDLYKQKMIVLDKDFTKTVLRAERDAK
jgi:predicted RNA-binding protein (virulence factor B family)